MIDSGRGTARVEDAQGIPTHNHISPSILVYGDEGSHPANTKLTPGPEQDTVNFIQLGEKYILMVANQSTAVRDKSREWNASKQQWNLT